MIAAAPALNSVRTSIASPVQSTKGYLRPSILWHLMEEGNASLARLHQLIGSPAVYINRQLAQMCTLGQVMHARPADAVACNVRLYALTPAGIEAARRIESHQVEFAS